MLKKKYVIIAILIFIVLIGLFSAIAGKNNKSLRTIDYILTDSEKTQGVADNEASAEEYNEGKSLYERSYETADAFQKEQLENITKDFPIGIGEYPKQIMIIMNQLPEETQNLTLEEARKICEEFDGSGYNSPDNIDKALADKFNEIAGAPDFYGGSGTTIWAYYTDASHNAYIMITLGNVIYNNANSNEKEIIFSLDVPESDDSKGETDRIIRSKQPHDFRVPAWSDPEGAVDKTISANADDISDKIPVYYEEELLLKNSRAFDLGGDAAIFDTFNIRPNHPGVILTVYPTDAIRERDNNSLYFIYDTDTGYRLFLYFKKNENNTIILQGYPVVVKELLSYSDFESIKTGDSIKAVEDIDSTAELYEKHYIEVWNMDYKAVENHNKLGDPCVSIHYLTDGILKIRYDMTEDNELIVAETEFSEDYTFIDRRGDKVNYKIEEVDLPIQK